MTLFLSVSLWPLFFLPLPSSKTHLSSPLNFYYSLCPLSPLVSYLPSFCLNPPLPPSSLLLNVLTPLPLCETEQAVCTPLENVHRFLERQLNFFQEISWKRKKLSLKPTKLHFLALIPDCAVKENNTTTKVGWRCCKGFFSISSDPKTSPCWLLSWSYDRSFEVLHLETWPNPERESM